MRRGKKSVEALRNGDLLAFGKLMYQSHYSLKNDYEVTGKELDALVEKLTTGVEAFTGKDPIDSFCGLWDAKI